MSDTPRTDEHWWSIKGSLYWMNHPTRLEMEAMERELAELHEWKKQALAVMPDFQQIGNALSLPLGSNVSEEILPGINRLKDQRDSLADALRDMLKLDDESEAAMQEIGVPALEDEHPAIRNARKALAAVKGDA